MSLKIDDSANVFDGEIQIGTIAEAAHSWLSSQPDAVRTEFLGLHIQWIETTLRAVQIAEANLDKFRIEYKGRVDERLLSEAKADFDRQIETLNQQIEQKDATIAQLQSRIAELTAPPKQDWQRLALEWPKTTIGQLSRKVPEVDQAGIPLAILAQNVDAVRSAFVNVVEQLGDRASEADIDEVDRLFRGCGV